MLSCNLLSITLKIHHRDTVKRRMRETHLKARVGTLTNCNFQVITTFVYNVFFFQGEYQAAVDIYDEEVQDNFSP